MKKMICGILASVLALGAAIPAMAATAQLTTGELVIGYSQEQSTLSQPGETLDINITHADGTAVSRADGKTLTESWFKDNYTLRISNKKGGVTAVLAWDSSSRQPYIEVKLPATSNAKAVDYSIKLTLHGRKDAQAPTFTLDGTAEYNEESASEYLHLSEGETKLINFKEMNSRAEYELIFDNAATATWKAYEDGKKIFGFEVNDNTKFLSKYDSKFDDVEYFQMSFKGNASFASEAKIVIHSEITDAKEPALYTLASDGTLTEMTNVKYDKSTGDFTFNSKKLPASIVAVDKKISGITTDSSSSTPNGGNSTITPDKPATPSTPSTGTGTAGGKDNPQTGVGFNFMPLMIALGAVVMAGGVLVVKRK